ncbi:MAG TPA: hypothetical protein DCS82_04460 [Rhodospirillaceae bacterium]|nr:hypothetical protein [Rhodospirillaceae bacterium]HAA93139.1 hypothetical protein [Rhodospirillaceae bacterium]HAT34946.1 hypothetical protein [Rhodospirillaceae bacterium]
MSALAPFHGSAAWMGADLDKTEDWIWQLHSSELDELAQAVEGSTNLKTEDIKIENFPLPTLGPRLERLRDEIRNGIGFGVVRGIPTKQMTDDQVFRTFWGIGTHLGFAISQNSYGDMLGHVYDEKPDPSEVSPRGYRTNKFLRFHTDRADIVGLLCLRKAFKGGESSIASSMSIYNAILKHHPTYMDFLFKGYMHAHAEDVGLDKPRRLPVFHVKDDVLSCRMNRGPIENSHIRAGVPISPEEARALVAFDFYAEHPDYRLDMMLLDGDIQFVNNYRVVHSRKGFTDGKKREETRHMVRLWLNYYNDPWPRGPHLSDYNGVPKKLDRST